MSSPLMEVNQFPSVVSIVLKFAEMEYVFGTSASSPTFGSVITLINDARLAVGKKPVGMS